MIRSCQLTADQNQELKGIIEKPRDYSTKEVLRAQVILLMSQGISLSTIIIATGYHRRQLFNIRHAYFAEGKKGILEKRKGKAPCLLNKMQREEIEEILVQTTPLDFGYRQEGWTTSLLANLIEARYHVRYASKTSYYLLFKEARFTYHKPGRVYEKHDEQVVKHWKTAVHSRIPKALKDKGTVILTEDEMVLSTQTTTQKIWLKQGDYPKIEVASQRRQRSIYGFLNIKTGQEHAFKKPRQNSEMTIECLKAIRNRYKDKEILLLWDNAQWHHAGMVKAFTQNDQHIEVIPFPAYTPEENPQEHVWKAGRTSVTHNRFIDDIDEATDDFVHYLNKTKFKYKLLGYGAVS